MNIESDFENLKAIREDFSEYKISDGNILRVKDVLISFMASPQKIEKDRITVKLGMQVQPIAGVIPTGSVDISKLKYVEGVKATEQDRISKLDFEPIKVMINLYETDGLIILLKSKLLDIWSTKFKDKNNTPIYNFNTSAVIDVINKKEIGEPHEGTKTVTIKS